MLQFINRLGFTADLYPDTSITIERNNPLFIDNDKFFEDITYDFTMPATENNKEFFGSGHLIEALNSVYELEVQTIYGGAPFYAGVMAYTVVGGEFSATLKINFGALATSIQNVKMCEIFTDDALPNDYTAAFMKTVCQNPSEYPFSFFPIYNEKWDKTGGTTHFTINNWDHAAQEFSLIGVTSRDYTASCPFWKLKHYIIKTMKYLGFECTGDFINDSESDKIYIYTRLSPALKIYGSTIFLPGQLKISDFLKLVKERFNICFSFDLFSGTVNVQSGNSLLSSNKVINISDFIEDITEIRTPEQDGYTITLKADDQDELFKDPINTDETKYIPTNKVIVGNGAEEIEIQSSTLKSKLVADYSMPTTKQQVYIVPYDEIPNYPLRVLKYNGMKSVAGGKFFPEALPMELDMSDTTWYRFRNDSKPLKVTAKLPLYLLMQINPSVKLAITSKENAYSTTIIEKITFNIEDKEAEYIEATIDCHPVVANYSTPVTIEPFTTTLEEDKARPKFKALFDYSTTGLDEIEIELYYPNGKTGTEAYAPRTDIGKILKTTDKGGANGYVVNMPLVYVPHGEEDDTELRIRKGTPKYIIQNGIKRMFTSASGYVFIKSLNFGSRFTSQDGQPVWIVF